MSRVIATVTWSESSPRIRLRQPRRYSSSRRVAVAIARANAGKVVSERLCQGRNHGYRANEVVPRVIAYQVAGALSGSVAEQSL